MAKWHGMGGVSATPQGDCMASPWSAIPVRGVLQIIGVSMDQQQHRSLIRRQDYQPPEFRIERTRLEIDLDAERTEVSSWLTIRRAQRRPGQTLVLHGVDLELLEVIVDGRSLGARQYRCVDEVLSISEIPDKDEFEVHIRVVNLPANNTALEGLYQSGQFLLTQCEAEGFRKITYYLDRPDVMAPFTVTLRGDKQRYPVLLSNGNPVDQGELDNGRHYVTWDDPFPKPAYLFALVAGDLEWIEDHYTTRSGRQVRLRIYMEKENRDRCWHAMDSLKNAMRWDEEAFGLEYDLDIYNIVVTNDFNMGAMENKGLNIFNAKYVLADPETATDWDYQAIEGVIGHEYFHNWTGNRVTCRDWFQLTLKEGLTVFRDQEFSADMQIRAVKRINDVRDLRRRQFPEDAGPMSHPVRPDQYIEISNFYTATVYQKGAEVVRMYQTLLGQDKFKQGLKLYLERHDGQAATCDDFLNAMAEAGQTDLAQFARWYSQPGTPLLTVKMDYDDTAETCSFDIRQSVPGYPQAPALLIPISIGLIDRNGDPIPLQLDDQAQQSVEETQVLVLTEKEQRFTFKNVKQKPLPSILRGYSAPVKVDIEWCQEDLALLIQHDNDAFSRWDAAETLHMQSLLSMADGLQRNGEANLDPLVVTTYRNIIEDVNLDPGFAAELLSLPSENYLCEQTDPVIVEAIHEALLLSRRTLATELTDCLRTRYHQLHDANWSAQADAVGRRRLKNLCLDLLCAQGLNEDFELAERQYRKAYCMTDRLAALTILVHGQANVAQTCLADFAQRYGDNPLVMDKWFTIQAMRPQHDTINHVRALMSHPAYSNRNPNKIRALLGAFALNNPMGFHKPDGQAYILIADEVMALDRMNPQTASRLALSFNRWSHMDEARGTMMREQLQRIQQASNLSPDVYEVVNNALKSKNVDYATAAQAS